MGEDLPRRCCFCCPATRNYDCARWYKLAPTPYHVVLSALASGAGFEIFENMMYIFSPIMHNEQDKELAHAKQNNSFNATSSNLTDFASHETRSSMSVSSKVITIGVGRALTSGMHIAWTGLIGMGLAERLFLPEGRRPSLARVVLPPMILHGLFDYSISVMPVVDFEYHAHLITSHQWKGWLTFSMILFLSTCCGSYCVIMRRTGCKVGCCYLRCCCAAGFWEERYAASQLGALEAPLVADQDRKSVQGSNTATVR